MSSAIRKSVAKRLRKLRSKKKRAKNSASYETLDKRMLLAADVGIVNGSFESYTGPNRWVITQDLDGWRGVDASSVTQDATVDLGALPSSEGIELWRNLGKKTYAGQNQIELDGYGSVIDGLYQEFSTDEATNLMFAAYARKFNTSDIEVYIDGQYVETVTPPTAQGNQTRQAYFYQIDAGDHSILFKEVNEQSDGLGAVIDNVRLVSNEMKMMLDSAGRHTHNFYEHVMDMFGEDLMAPGQTEYDAKGFEKVNDKLYRGDSPITGLRPIIEEAIDREIRRNPRLEGEALERKIANRLTNLNDFDQLQTETQDKLIEMTGINFREMSKKEREHTINHLQHSPIPFGNIEEVLTSDTIIDLGYTHTLDKNWTRVGHLGDGVWKVWIISNNNNGSHTGHNLGEFKVQLSEDTTVNEARAAANRMIKNTNNNNKLSLDEAARDILYGVTPRLDPVDRDAPVNDGIVNGSFESYTGRNGSIITDDVEGWYGVRAQTVNKEIGVDPDSLPSSDGIEIWRNVGKKTYAGQNQIELDGRSSVVDGVYQKFSTDEATNLMFTAYARKSNSSDIEVYIDGQYVETVTPTTAHGNQTRQAYFYEVDAGEHSILFKEVNGQNNGQGAVIDNIRLVTDGMKMMLDSAGRHTHNFYEHVMDMFGEDLMAPGQTEYDAKGFEKVNDTLYKGDSPITGLRPVIEEAIDREIRRNPRLEGEALERKIANRLTNLNDFSQLQTETQDMLIELTGINFREMSKQEREHTINHLLHSPIPFGNIEEVLSPDTTIDLGYTHTLDKNWTRVGHLGDGVWKVWMISNNNNGSHTGHNLGEFKVQLSEDTTVNEARAAANRMIKNTNNNNKLSLDEAARDILYGVTPRLDPVDRDAPVNDGIVNGSFESYTGRNGSIITDDVEGWYGVRAQTVNKEIGVDPDSLPSSDGIEIWRNVGKKTYAGQNQIELDGRSSVVDGVYQKFSTDEATNLMFTAYARRSNSSDIEVYIDGQYVETVTPPTAHGNQTRQAYFYEVDAGEHSILFKEVNGQNNGQGAVIDNIRLVSDGMKMMLDSAGRHTHNFYEHVMDMFGEDLMAPGQTEYDAKGFEKVNDKLYRGDSPITGLRPIIEEAIDREIRRNPRLEGEALERKIANRLTNLNDFDQLQTETQDKLIEMTGINFREMSKKEREHTINHLQHSPIPFGNIEEVLTPDTIIDLGYTHTLDKNWTRVGHLGDGVWKVWIISNNNNGSHTGHNLGEFKVQLSEDTTVNEARAAANRMIKNTNNNNKLSLDEAAKDILYGVTPRLDPVDRDAPVNDGIVNGSFESFTGRNGWTITDDVEGWYGVRAQTVNKEIGVDPDSLPSSDGIEIWRNYGKKTYAGQNQIELDGHNSVVDGVYQKFSTDEATNLMFTAYARKSNSSDIEVYIDGQYVETVTPPSAHGNQTRQAYFYEVDAGEHSILFKEVTGQNNGLGAVIDNVRLVSNEMKMMLDSAGRHTHNFYEHVMDMFGEDLMAPGQTEYDAKGFEKVNDRLYRGNSPITGLLPIIEEAINTEILRNPGLQGEALEAKIANRLTNLNDFDQLKTETQDKLIEMTGINFREMSKKEREHTINHLQHSPIPFGNIEEVLTPDTTIDLGYTHTLDKNWTRVGHLGDGVWKVWIISNNNNGSHTGHNLGEFKVQLSEDTTVNEARAAANRMIQNTNNNNRLSLDEAAKAILYGDGVDEAGSFTDNLEADSLRRLVLGANASESTNTINLQAGTYELTRRNSSDSGGDLDIRSHIVIVGEGADKTTIDANAIDRIFDIHSGGTLELRDLTLTGGKAGHGGGIYARGDVLLTDVIMTENRSSYEGGAIYVASGSTSLDGAMLDNNTGRSGGAVYVKSNATLAVDDSSLSDNVAKGYGGAIFTHGNSLEIVDSNLDGNEARYEGGAVYVSKGIAAIDGSTLDENLGRSGGAIFVNSNVSLEINDSSLSDNGADGYGGAIYFKGRSIEINGSNLDGNDATYEGGAMYVRNGTANIAGSTVDENSGRSGGAIFVNSNAWLNVNDSSLSDNSADGYGGAIFSKGRAVTITASDLDGNMATYEGGAIYSGAGSTTINDSMLSENSGRYGGAIYNKATLNLIDTSLLDNSGTAMGDEIYQSRQGRLQATNLELADDFFSELNENGEFLLD